MTELEIIGRNIFRLRTDLDLTQEDLSGIAEVDRGFISNLENGKANVSVNTLITIATCLNSKLADLVMNTDLK